MTFEQLRYFMAVAELGSFSNASMALYISQSTLSKQIAALEEELGVQLFDRKFKSIELTQAGRVLQVEATHTLDIMEEAQSAIQYAKTGAHALPRLNFAMDTKFMDAHRARTKITSVIYEARKKMPNLTVKDVPCEDTSVLKRLCSGELDIYFCGMQQGMELPDKCLSKLTIGHDELIFMLRQDLVEHLSYQERIALLGDMNIYILSGDNDGFFSGMNIFRQLGIAPEIRFLATPPQATLIAEMGQGAILCSRSSFENIAGFVRSPLTYIRPEVDLINIDLNAVWNNREVNPVVSLILEGLS